MSVILPGAFTGIGARIFVRVATEVVVGDGTGRCGDARGDGVGNVAGSVGGAGGVESVIVSISTGPFVATAAVANNKDSWPHFEHNSTRNVVVLVDLSHFVRDKIGMSTTVILSFSF